MKSTKSLVLIDGSNFYFKLKSLGLSNLLTFDFTSFIKLIARKSSVTKSTYYVGAVKVGRTKQSQKLHASQQKLLTRLKKHQLRYSLGYLLKSDHVYHEKGVDVGLAVDMLIAAYENQADRIILVSSIQFLQHPQSLLKNSLPNLCYFNSLTSPNNTFRTQFTSPLWHSTLHSANQ